MKMAHKREFKAKQLRDQLNQVRKATPGVPKAVRAEIANDVLGDLPDGAFFAAAGDMFGLDSEDFA